jgi:hypothetical protein
MVGIDAKWTNDIYGRFSSSSLFCNLKNVLEAWINDFDIIDPLCTFSQVRASVTLPNMNTGGNAVAGDPNLLTFNFNVNIKSFYIN